MTSTLYACWRGLQDTRRKQGFSSTTANLTVRKVNKGYEEGNVDDVVDDSNNERDYEGGRRRRYRRGKDRGSDNGRDRGPNNWSKDVRNREESDNDENGSNKFRFLLESLPDLLDKVKDVFLRDAAVAGELKHHEMQDQLAATSSILQMSGKDKPKHRNSQIISRSSVTDGETVIPLGELDEFNVYVAQSLPNVLECLGELLRGNPGPRDDLDNPGRGRYSLSPEYVIRVSEEGQITANTFLNATELYRRRLLNELRYKFVLVVNGKAVTHSEYVELRHPSLIAEINQYFELRLLYEPSDLAIDIIAVNMGTLSCLKKGAFQSLML